MDVEETRSEPEPSVPVEVSFPHLQLGPLEVVIPYVVVPTPAADFTNSRNEASQLNAWISNLDRDKIVSLLGKLFEYGRGSLYAFMYAWCARAEDFDPALEYDWLRWVWVVDAKDCLRFDKRPTGDTGALMWMIIKRRSSTHNVDLRRLLHFLILLYSNDRLPSRYSGKDNPNGQSEMGAPGELVAKMRIILEEPTCNTRETKYPKYHPCSCIHQQQKRQGVDFATLAPGWVDYMKGPMGPLRKALSFLSLDDTQSEEVRLADELFAKGVRISHPTLRRTLLATINESIDKEEAPIDRRSRETEKYLCSICMASDRKVVFMPCSHFVTCKLCSESCDVCPICRNALMGKLEVFL